MDQAMMDIFDDDEDGNKLPGGFRGSSNPSDQNNVLPGNSSMFMNSQAFMSMPYNLPTPSNNHNLQHVSGSMTHNVTPVSGAMNPVSGGMSNNMHSVPGGMSSNLHSVSGGLNNNLQSVSGGMSSNLHSVSGGMNSSLNSVSGGVNSNLQSVSGGMTSSLHSVSGGKNSSLHSVSSGMNSSLHSVSGGMGSNMHPISGGMGSNMHPISGGMGSNMHPISGGMGSNMHPISGGMGSNMHPISGGMGSNLHSVSGGMGSNLHSVSGGMGNNMQSSSSGTGHNMPSMSGGMGMGNNLHSVSGGMGSNMQSSSGGMSNNMPSMSGGMGMTHNMQQVSGARTHNMQSVSGTMTHNVPPASSSMTSHHMHSISGTMTHNTQPTSGTMTHNSHPNSGSMQPNSNSMTHNMQPGSSTMTHNVQPGSSTMNHNVGAMNPNMGSKNNNLQSVSGIMNHTMQSGSSNSQITGASSVDDYSENTSQWQQLGSDNSDTGQRSGVPKRPGSTFQQAISFGALMPMLIPNLPHDKQSTLINLYQKLKTSEISKEDFLRNTRMVVGDQVLVGAVRQLQMQKQSQGPMSRQQVMQAGDQQQHSLIPKHMMQQRPPLTPPSKLSNESTQQQCQSATQAQDVEPASAQKPQQQPQQAGMETNPAQYQNNPRVSTMRNHPPDLRNQVDPSSASGSVTVQQVKYEINKDGESVRGAANTVSLNFQSNNSSHSLPTVANVNSIPSFPGALSNTEAITPQANGDGASALQPKSKKQKTGGDVLEESIDQLNDVTAVSGVNLREEEEQLLAGPKEESRTTNAIRRFAQEEEGRLFLEKVPLHAKVTSIAAKYGVTVVSEDVDQCLSMSLEERLRNMLYKLTKISSWSHDSEKDTNKIVVTCDIQRRITLIRKRAKEAHERKQALETERLRKLNEEKEKASENEDPTCTSKKDKKAQKGEEGKQKPSVANVASRSSAGVNDMLLKWQMMAEQGRQKREGTNDTNALDSSGNDKKPSSGHNKTTGTTGGEGEHKNTNVGGVKRSNGNDTSSNGGLGRQGNRSNPSGKTSHTITTKDVMHLLEMDPQMARSPLLYRLYAKHVSCNKR